MRAILDQPRDRAAIPLVLAAGFISSLGDANLPGARDAIGSRPMVLVVLAGVAVIVVATLVTLFFFYLFGWIATYIGRFFEGNGKPREIRSALAWGLAPMIWSLIYRLPAAFLLPGGPARFGRGGGDNFVIEPGRFASGCGAAILFTFLELVMLGWCVYVTSNTLGEAHGFSSWRGLATYLLSVLSPLVVVLAAVLTMIF
jgi:hypothetical protein